MKAWRLLQRKLYLERTARIDLTRSRPEWARLRAWERTVLERLVRKKG